MTPVEIQLNETLKLHMYTGKKDNLETILKPRYAANKFYREEKSAIAKLEKAKEKYNFEIDSIFAMDSDSRLSITQSIVTTKECITSVIHQYILNPNNPKGYDVVPDADIIVPTMLNSNPSFSTNTSLLSGVDFAFITMSIAHGPDKIFTGVPAFGQNFRFYHTVKHAYEKIEKLYKNYDWIFPKDKDFTIKIWKTKLKYGHSPVELIGTYEVDDEDTFQLKLV